MVLTDRMGRRLQVFVGATIQTCALMTMGGLGTVSDASDEIKSGIVAMMVVFTFGYALGWAPTAHILSAEIPSTRLRDMTYRTASVLNIAVQ
jgi:SP family sugar:H+ symporter-like MFS transporter